MNTRTLDIPIIRTERLRLEPLSGPHSAGMFQLWSDPDVCRFSGIVRDHQGRIIPMPTATRSESDRIIDFWQHAAEDGWGYRWAVMMSATEAFTGIVGFNSVTACAELAYHLLPGYWGKGIMSEACRAAIDWQQASGTTELEAFVEPENTASVVLAERLGLTPTDEYTAGARRFHRTLDPQGFNAR